MVTRVSKRKHFELYKQSLDLRVALSLLSVFTLLVSIYLIASCGRLVSSIAVSIESPAVSVIRGVDDKEVSDNRDFGQFKSQDDIKKYIDDGKRLYGDGIFESPGITPLAQAGKEILSVSGGVAKGAKNAPVVNIDPLVARKYFSLDGNTDPTRPDIAQINKTNIFFSPENQYYTGAIKNKEQGNQDEFRGLTRVLSAFPVDTLSQIETIPADGEILLAGKYLMVFSGNSLTAFNSEPVFGRQEIWRGRISEEGELIGARSIGEKIYLAVRTKLDEANPCPVKPITVNEQPLLVKCADIYYPKSPMLADSIVTIIEVAPDTGKIEKNLSYLSWSSGSAAVFTESAAYAVWPEGGDYIGFVTNFLNEKCKSLLPNYILEKADDLGDYNISLLAKEMELRSMLMNWLSTLSAEEQERITGEMAKRLADYLGGNYQPFEKTRITKIDINSFKFLESTQIAGQISDESFVNAPGGNVTVATVSGKGAYEKIYWLFSGEAEIDQTDKPVNSLYILDANLKIAGAAENMGIPSSLCAIRYAGDIAYASDCDGNKIFLINLSLDENAGLASEIVVGGADFYIYPFKNRQLLVISRNQRNIRLSIYDNTLVSKPEFRSKYDLADYWADFDGNYRAFANDDKNNYFFLPSGKGGHVFFHNGDSVEFTKTVGSNVCSRAYLSAGLAYLLSEGGVEVFGGEGWGDLGKMKFEN